MKLIGIEEHFLTPVSGKDCQAVAQVVFDECVKR